MKSAEQFVCVKNMEIIEVRMSLKREREGAGEWNMKWKRDTHKNKIDPRHYTRLIYIGILYRSQIQQVFCDGICFFLYLFQLCKCVWSFTCRSCRRSDFTKFISYLLCSMSLFFYFKIFIVFILIIYTNCSFLVFFIFVVWCYWLFLFHFGLLLSFLSALPWNKITYYFCFWIMARSKKTHGNDLLDASLHSHYHILNSLRL